VRPAAAILLAVAWCMLPAAAPAQTNLTLEEAMRRAQSATPEARALDARGREAAERVRQARAGYFPRIDFTESVERGDHPVFVFSSLLAQRRFAAENFAIGALNRPGALTNLRTGVMVDQTIFDGGVARLGVRRAELDETRTQVARAAAAQDLALGAAQRFVRVLQLESADRASRAAVESASSDLALARARRDAGLVTSADVLALEVHLAEMHQRQITTDGELEVARIELRDAIGAPPDEQLMLVPPAEMAVPADAEALVREALEEHPERASARLATRLAENARQSAEAALLPRVGVQGGWELNGHTFANSRSSWSVGAHVQLNLFRGFADAARIAEARHAQTRAAAEQEAAERRIARDVRTALARVNAARAREAAGRAASLQAGESQRIVRDRYESGLATAADVLQAAGAVLDAESRATEAETEVILQLIALERAVGRL
jgi:outer membrane protein TolC